MSSSLTRKSSWERPSSLYSASSAETSYTKPSYSSSSSGGDSGYSSKYSSTSSDYKPSWRSSLNSSDSNSSLTKYGSRPVSTVSESGSSGTSRFEASTPTPRSSWREAESSAVSSPTPRSSWRDSFKEEVSTTPKYGSLNRDGDSYLSRYSSRDSEDGISRFSSLRESRKGREEARLSREEIKEAAYTPSYRKEEKKEEPSYTPRYGREEKKDDSVTSRFSSLNKEDKKEETYSPRYSREELKGDAYKSSINREEKKDETYTPSYRREEKKDDGYVSRYSSLRDEKKIENGDTNGHSSLSRNTTTLHIEEAPPSSRFGSNRDDKKEETNGTNGSSFKHEEVSPKYKGYESILAKYGTGSHQTPTSQAATSSSHTCPATTVASPTDTNSQTPASYHNPAQYTSTATTSTSDSASSSRPSTSSLPVPGSVGGAVPSPYSRTNSNSSTSSLAVPGNASTAYSRTNSNTSTTGVEAPSFGSSPYGRQLSKENNGVGHLADESSLSRSLERRASSKKLPFGPSGPAPPTFSAFEKTIEKSNTIQEKIEATLNKHNVGPKQVRDISTTSVHCTDAFIILAGGPASVEDSRHKHKSNS